MSKSNGGKFAAGGPVVVMTRPWVLEETCNSDR